MVCRKGALRRTTVPLCWKPLRRLVPSGQRQGFLWGAPMKRADLLHPWETVWRRGGALGCKPAADLKSSRLGLRLSARACLRDARPRRCRRRHSSLLSPEPRSPKCRGQAARPRGVWPPRGLVRQRSSSRRVASRLPLSPRSCCGLQPQLRAGEARQGPCLLLGPGPFRPVGPRPRRASAGAPTDPSYQTGSQPTSEASADEAAFSPRARRAGAVPGAAGCPCPGPARGACCCPWCCRFSLNERPRGTSFTKELSLEIFP